MSGHYSYILICSDGTLYSGYTVDPQKRLAAHNAGRGAKYTRTRRPVKLAALWQWPDRHAAMSAEWLIKRLTREKKLALLGTPENIRALCPPPLKIFPRETLADFGAKKQ